MSEEAILIHPDFEKPFVLWCDASSVGAGAVLTQNKGEGCRPVAYASCTFDKAQRNYSTTQREGLAVVWAVAHYRSYIHGTPTVVITDHSALTWILSLKEPSARLARWAMALMDYDLTFVHRPGKGNAIADALSRLEGRDSAIDPERVAEEINPVVVGVITTKVNPKTTLKEHGFATEENGTNGWKQTQRTDPIWKLMIQFLEENKLPESDTMARWVTIRADDFAMLHGILCRIKITTKAGVSNTDGLLHAFNVNG